MKYVAICVFVCLAILALPIVFDLYQQGGRVGEGIIVSLVASFCLTSALCIAQNRSEE